MKEIDQLKNMKRTFMKVSARFDKPNESCLKLQADLQNHKDVLEYHEKIKSQLENNVAELFEKAVDFQYESDLSKSFDSTKLAPQKLPFKLNLAQLRFT